MIRPNDLPHVLSALSVAACIAMTLAPSRADPMDDTLALIGMSKADITIDPDIVPSDPFRLKVAVRLLSAPLEMPDYAQDLAARLAAAPSLKDLVTAAYAAIETPPPVQAPAASESAAPDDPESEIDRLVSLLAGDGRGKSRSRNPLKCVARGTARLFSRGRRTAALRESAAALPGPARAALLGLLEALGPCQQTFARAAADLTPAECDLLRDKGPELLGIGLGVENAEELDEAFFEAATRFDLAAARDAAALLAAAVDDAIRRLAEIEPDTAPEGVLLDSESSWGRVIVLGAGPQTVADSAALVLDLGGDDRYAGTVGGARNGVSVLIDLSGNDLYEADDDVALGAAVWGTAFLVDLAGDDHYRARSFGLGASCFGTGVAADAGGDDLWEAETNALGSGACGIGVVYERGGEDTYLARNLVMGVGNPRGFGAVVDCAGNDVYHAGAGIKGWSTSRDLWKGACQGFGRGVRQYASGGVGLLLDVAGTDVYETGSVGQGVGYWYGVGLLVEGGGDDRYLAQHYCQGDAFHYAVGALLDNAGNDCYLGGVTSLGGTWDYAPGVFVDYGGNDLYHCTTISAGAASVTSFGIFVDNAGDDVYHVRKGHTLGSGTMVQRRGFEAVGVFLDLAGTDVYPAGGPYADNKTWTQGQCGAGSDLAAGKPFYAARPLPLGPLLADMAKPGQAAQPAAQTEELPKSVPDIIAYLSTWDFSEANREKLLPALRQGRAEAIPILMRNLTARPFFRSYGFYKGDKYLGGAYGLLPELGRDAVEALAAGVAGPDVRLTVRSIQVLGRIDYSRDPCGPPDANLHRVRDEKVVPAVMEAVKAEHPLARSAAAAALGRLKPAGALAEIAKLARDERFMVRLAAVRALGRIGAPEGAEALARALGDPYYGVRRCASRALIEVGQPALGQIRSALPGLSDIHRPLAEETIKKIEERK